MIKKNKLWLIGVYALIAVLIGALIVLSVVKVNYKPEITSPYLINIEYYATKPIACSQQDVKDRYDAITKEFDLSFTETALTSFFSGRRSENKIVEITNSDIKDTFTGFKVTFTYLTEQTIMFNNKPYNPPTDTSKTIKYTNIIFDVTETKGIVEHKIYYESYNTTKSKNIYYEQTVICDWSDLYSLLSSY